METLWIKLRKPITGSTTGGSQSFKQFNTIPAGTTTANFHRHPVTGHMIARFGNGPELSMVPGDWSYCDAPHKADLEVARAHHEQRGCIYTGQPPAGAVRLRLIDACDDAEPPHHVGVLGCTELVRVNPDQWAPQGAQTGDCCFVPTHARHKDVRYVVTEWLYGVPTPDQPLPPTHICGQATPCAPSQDAIKTYPLSRRRRGITL
jgi:hypothetical protein